jgi:hypothetical protein
MSATETIPANNRRVIAFRWVLPISEILLCAALLWPWRGFLTWQLRSTGHAYWPTTIEGPEPVHLDIKSTGDTKTPQKINAEKLLEIRVSAPAVLNIPCSLFGLLRREAVPRGMLPEFWRSLSWPFFGIAFWWIAGRGIEALVASRRRLLSPAITWIEVFVASLVIVPGVFIWLLFFSGDRAGFVFPWPGALSASAMWILLGGATIAARIAQWHIRRGSKTDRASLAGAKS